MNEIFFQAPCLSADLPLVRFDDLRVKWFPKSDKRYPVQVLQRLIDYNKEEFAFLGVTVKIVGSDKTAALQFVTDRFVGAVALRSPDNGKALGDLAIYPRFTRAKEIFGPIIELLPILGMACRPEFINKTILSSGAMVKPPLYYDAVLFVDAIQKVLHSPWRKFRSEERLCRVPTAGTRWDKYAECSVDVGRSLRFPSKDNILSVDHHEWGELLYVYDKAVAEIQASETPEYIRRQALETISSINKFNASLPRRSPCRIVIHAADPIAVKEAKELANIILRQSFKEPKAWRLDLAEFFERYCQFVVDAAARDIAAKVVKNPRMHCSRRECPPWGVSYLEPDMVVHKALSSVAVDAKYKAHMFHLAASTDELKETHRHDLHQLLAYCAFEQSMNKVGMLVYPSFDRVVSRILEYRNFSNGVRNTVILMGIPIGLYYLRDIRAQLHNHLQTVS